MIINREDILDAILKHKHHFYKFVDTININASGMQFPIGQYSNFYADHVDVAGGRYVHLLSIEALVNANVFVNIDRNSALITLSKEVYNILVWLDISRKKQLDSQLFESHRLDVIRLVKDLKRLPIGSQDFEEAHSFFYEKISDIQSDISENVRVLDDKVNQIADMYKKRELGAAEIGLDEIYDKALRIYNRNIMPCLEFINPYTELKQSTNLSETLRELEVYFESVGEIEESRRLQYRSRAVFSYYKDIGVVADRLSSYLTSISHDRRFFLSMEKAFGILLESIVPLRDGGIVRKKMNEKSKVFELTDIFDGLKQSMTAFDARLNYSPDYAMDHFESYFELVQKRKLNKKTTNRKRPVPISIDADAERIETILSIAVVDIKIPDYIEDIQSYVWEQLQRFLPDATMLDFLPALEYFLGGLEDCFVRQRRQGRNRIADDNYYFDYLIWDYIKGEHHG